MKSQTIINIAIILLIFGLYYTTCNKPVVVNDNKNIIDSLIQDSKIKIMNDSVLYENKIDILNQQINHVKKIRKNEHDKYQQEIAKYNRLFDSTDFTRINDSIKKVCCSNNPN